MTFPWADWQFWTVTVAAAGGAWTVLRQFLPRRDRSPACGSCATGAAACASKPDAESDDSALVVLGER